MYIFDAVFFNQLTHEIVIGLARPRNPLISLYPYRPAVQTSAFTLRIVELTRADFHPQIDCAPASFRVDFVWPGDPAGLRLVVRKGRIS